MFLNDKTADHIIDAAVSAFPNEEALKAILEGMAVPIYVTDRDGTISYFNPACVPFAGRQPELGTDRYCVTWKLFTVDGQPLPHDRCPLAVALKEQRSVRDAEAIAERPDGSRVRFVPYATPIFGVEGNLVGAVNLLMEVSREDKSEYLREQASRCRSLAEGDNNMSETLMLMAAKYDQHAMQLDHPDRD